LHYAIIIKEIRSFLDLVHSKAHVMRSEKACDLSIKCDKVKGPP
jgi:hypothetical protein